MRRLLTELSKRKSDMWDLLRSPKTVAALKLGAALIGVIHAIDEWKESARSGKKQIGFHPEQD